MSASYGNRFNDQQIGLSESRGRINFASERASDVREPRPDPYDLSSASLQLTSGQNGGKYA